MRSTSNKSTTAKRRQRAARIFGASIPKARYRSSRSTTVSAHRGAGHRAISRRPETGFGSGASARNARSLQGAGVAQLRHLRTAQDLRPDLPADAGEPASGRAVLARLSLGGRSATPAVHWLGKGVGSGVGRVLYPSRYRSRPIPQIHPLTGPNPARVGDYRRTVRRGDYGGNEWEVGDAADVGVNLSDSVGGHVGRERLQSEEGRRTLAATGGLRARGDLRRGL